MTMTEDRPAPAAGHNRVAVSVAERLAEDYAELLSTVEKLATEATAGPATIDDDETSNRVADLVKSVGAAAKRAESVRVSEKEPHLQAGRDIDGFFKTKALDRLDRIKKALEARVTDYLQRKAREERRRREEEERKAREEAARALREAEERERAARQAREEEERARRAAEAAPATAFEAQPMPVASFAAAEQARANDALEEAAAADVAAQRAARDAAAKPAELARTRGESSLSTLKETWEFEILDAKAIPLSVLRPFVPLADIEKYVRAFVKVGHRELEGVRIFKTETAVIR